MDWQIIYNTIIQPILIGIAIGWFVTTFNSIKAELVAIRKLIEKQEREK